MSVSSPGRRNRQRRRHPANDFMKRAKNHLVLLRTEKTPEQALCAQGHGAHSRQGAERMLQFSSH